VAAGTRASNTDTLGSATARVKVRDRNGEVDQLVLEILGLCSCTWADKAGEGARENILASEWPSVNWLDLQSRYR
jgi:hypothetical protein